MRVSPIDAALTPCVVRRAATNLAELFAGAPPGAIGAGGDGKKKRRKRGEGKSKEDKPKRAPTEFNIYMSTQVKEVKNAVSKTPSLLGVARRGGRRDGPALRSAPDRAGSSRAAPWGNTDALLPPLRC